MSNNRETGSLGPSSNKSILASSDRACFFLCLWGKLYSWPMWYATHLDRQETCNQSCSPAFTHSGLYIWAAILRQDPRLVGMSTMVWCLPREWKERLKAHWPWSWFCPSWGFASLGNFFNFMKITKYFVGNVWAHNLKGEPQFYILFYIHLSKIVYSN